MKPKAHFLREAKLGFARQLADNFGSSPFGEPELGKMIRVLSEDGLEKAELSGVSPAMAAHRQVQPEPNSGRATQRGIPFLREAPRRIAT
jgi:hypothetical protein